MEIRQVLEPLIKWWKLILIACLLAGLSSFLVVRQQPPIYSTRAALVIGKAVYEPNPSGGELGLASQLADYYADIAQREVVRDATMKTLSLEFLPEYAAVVIPNSQIIEITVTDTDPLRAQAVANELANQLIQQSPTNPDLQEQKRQDFIAGQLTLLETQIDETLDEIDAKEEQLGGLNSAREISQAQLELATLRQKLTTLQSNYAAMLNSSTGRASNSLSVLETASLPAKPIGPNRALFILISLAIAFLVSAGAAYLIEYLDDTLRTPEEINRLLRVPVIGYISEIEMDDQTQKGSIVMNKPSSLTAEAFRALKVNLEYPNTSPSTRSTLVASVSKMEGKSVVASNLALSMALSGKKVILVDADLRRPSLHTYLDLPNTHGLSDVLRDEICLDEAITRTEIENFSVLTTGSSIPNASDYLDKNSLDLLLNQLTHLWDFVVIDGPPILVTDTSILANKAESVLIVVGYGQTRKSQALLAMKQLERVEANIAGVVLNKIPSRNQEYYNLYHYDYGLEQPQPKEKFLEIGKWKIPLNFKFRKPGAKQKPKSKPDRTMNSEQLQS
jgi:capsular exopolysaccharide synthesis family protein